MARREAARSVNMLLLLAMAAAIATASANIAPAGPYSLKSDYFGACDDGEYPDQIVNMSLIWDDEVKETAFSGYMNKTYDDLADDCEMEVSVYKWGSTGGWTKFYSLSFTKPFDYMKENFPEVYEYLWYPMGIRKKPVLPGIYYMHRYWTRPYTLKRFVALPYGKFKMYTKSTKDGKRPTCTQLAVTITEVGLDHDPGENPPV